ncbi:MAG TPA: GlcNAc-PI de-N-acetylase [Acidobacterium sp.]|uniref:GlcNAc-PI de-N-acetylase family protein n=2 Tax=Acidobacteriaceae TaxID=204434 RepID=C1F6G6_ACIC5|nr:GlcNAc-PI de-N-acetylase family protein [Acidobacterium capsulatum ATCC 51196]HCT60757.1 GlcNAc-PI de-N-acetylase [Acidobacterium sp.]
MTLMRPSLFACSRVYSRAVALSLAGALTASTLGAQVAPRQIGIAASASARPLAQDAGADGLAQTLRKLRTWGSMMMIVAHPDDEDGGLLTDLSRGHGDRVALFTITRGEGGQNAMSNETEDGLGLIRTNELLAADRYYGAQQYFSHFVDYGFSKTITEAHRKWGDENVLRDVVRAVRMYRPLVVSSVFVGGITDGHGHHQVAGEMAQKVFRAAGDPKVFPDQIAEGLEPWSPLKVYARVPSYDISSKGMYDYATHHWAPVRFYNYVTQTWSAHVPKANVVMHEGQWDPVLGESYNQMARTGWSHQKSQFGGGFIALPGPADVSYHLYGSRVPASRETYQNGLETSFFDGIDTSLPGIAMLAHSAHKQFLVAALQQISEDVKKATAAYQPTHPEAIAPTLASGLKQTTRLIAAVKASDFSAADKASIVQVLEIKAAQFNTALAEALGLQVGAYAIRSAAEGGNPFLRQVPQETPAWVTPGSDAEVRVHVTAAQDWSNGGTLQLTRVWLANPNGDHWPVTQLDAASTQGTNATDAVFRASVPDDATLTRPYFTRPNTEQAHYEIRDARWAERPFAPYPLAGWAEFTYDGVPVRVGQVVQTVHREHGTGQVAWPLAVVPRLSVNLAAHAGIIPIGTETWPLTVTVRNDTQKARTAEVHLKLPQGWTDSPDSGSLQLAPGGAQDVTFAVHPKGLAGQNYEIEAVATSGGKDFAEGFDQVGYAGLRPYYLYQPATYRARGVAIQVPSDLKVGYIMGTGDDVPQALGEMGIHPTLLTDADLATGNLDQYNAILVGIRAYSARPALMANKQRLLNYVHQGGTLIVQYQRTEFGSAAPYPLSLGNEVENVVEESDTVHILQPNDPLLTTPNRITAADFDGWFEEFGHSFLSNWDAHYSALTEVHDPGQAPQRGGLVYARYGKGTYIYVSYALYRQLDEAVPGAFRLMANLISAGK